MKPKNNALYKTSITRLCNLLGTSLSELKDAIDRGYEAYYITKKKKKRLIEEPNKELKKNLEKLVTPLHSLDSPSYNYCGWPKQSALLNAKVHVGKQAFVTADISHYFPNTKARYVREFFANVLQIEGEALELLVKMTTFQDHLPTGAATSPILAFNAHRILFDEIAKEMEKRSITFTLYADDITLSAKHGITRAEIRYLQSILDKHGLKLKNKKTKFYNYKKALITGYYINQNGKISVPYSIGHNIIKKLKATPINEMNLKQVKSLLANIGYQRYVDKNAFYATRIKAIKHLKKLENL